MKKAVCVGSLTLDLFFQDDSLTIEKKRFFLAIGGKYVANYFSEAVGGGGGNVAVGLARSGIHSALFTEIGSGGVSQLILTRLKEEKVNTDFLTKTDNLINVSAILLSTSGERTIINHRSVKSQLQLHVHQDKLWYDVDALYLGNMPELELVERNKLLMEAKKRQILTFLNLGVKDCRRGLKALLPLLKSVDYLIINRFELADILDTPAAELFPKTINYCSRLFPDHAGTLILTDGEFGSYAQSKDGIEYQQALPVKKVIDATGAGDAFTSGFISGCIHDRTLKEALLAGARNSASVIQKINAQDGLLNQEQLFS